MSVLRYIRGKNLPLYVSYWCGDSPQLIVHTFMGAPKGAHTRTRARGVGEWAHCGALEAHLALCTRHVARGI
mgnify:CR=1 FL=1